MDDEQGDCAVAQEKLASSAAIVLDPALADVWQLVWSDDEDDAGFRNGVPLNVLAALLRLAYLQGYSDAVAEADPGALFRRLGVREDEKIRTPRRSARRRPRAPGSRGSSGR